jgi:hypothetical protein
MPPDEKRERPSLSTEATQGLTATSSDHMLPPSTVTSRDVLTHCHAVLVFTPEGRWTRRLYLSLHSADRAMERARARGLVAHCVLVTLVPVPDAPVTVIGGDQ